MIFKAHLHLRILEIPKEAIDTFFSSSKELNSSITVSHSNVQDGISGHTILWRNAKENLMKKQSLSKIARLIEQYPALAAIRAEFRNAKGQYPQTAIYVQRPDPDVMLYEGKGHMTQSGKYSYLMGEFNSRGLQTEYIYTVDHNDKPDERFTYFYVDHNVRIKDVFTHHDYGKVKYLILVIYRRWYWAPHPEAEALGSVIGYPKGEELTLVVYPKPKDKTWQELIEEADRLKEERENAWKNSPKVLHRLPGVHQALRDDFKLHAFLSGGGLRVITLTKGKTEFYGEHPNIEDALLHLNEDFLAGGIPYEEMYRSNGRHTHYLTGSSLASSNIDYWVRQGQTIDAWQEDDQVVCQLSGYMHQEIPPEILNEAKVFPGKKFWWRSRGYNFCTIYYEHLFANGDPGHRFWVVRKPKHDPEGTDTFFYPITKTGRGNTLWKAMLAALSAQEEGVIRVK